MNQLETTIKVTTRSKQFVFQLEFMYKNTLFQIEYRRSMVRGVDNVSYSSARPVTQCIITKDGIITAIATIVLFHKDTHNEKLSYRIVTRKAVLTLSREVNKLIFKGLEAHLETFKTI